MKEFELEKPIQMNMEQFGCQACEKKIYMNAEDFKDEVLDCPFCDVSGIKNTRLVEIDIKKIFEKEE